MIDAPQESRRGWTRRGAFAGVAVLACIGCCSIPFLAGLTIFGVALCSTKFLGVAFGAACTVAATVALVTYRRRKQRGPIGPVPVEFGVRRVQGDTRS